MYQPPHFREERPEVLTALIRAHPLGLLISAGGEDGPVANPIPFLFDDAPEDGGPPRLLAHLSRANAQWREIDGAPVLVVFQGADAYITPSWYETKRETGKVVPTWNYAIVQARGRARVFDDTAWLRAQVTALTARHEAAEARPWSLDDAPDAFIDAQLKGIVGLVVEITHLDGKWKVSQNRKESDRKGVVDGLLSRGEPGPAGEGDTMADLVRAAR